MIESEPAGQLFILILIFMCCITYHQKGWVVTEINDYRIKMTLTDCWSDGFSFEIDLCNEKFISQNYN
jgi:hypothetical protein